jgi:hypothetical protein
MTGPLCQTSWETRVLAARLAFRDGTKPWAGFASSVAGGLPTRALLAAAAIPATQTAATTVAATDLTFTYDPLLLAFGRGRRRPMLAHRPRRVKSYVATASITCSGMSKFA